jgi:hypothetical protein
MHELRNMFPKNWPFAIGYRSNERVRSEASLDQLIPRSVIDDPGAICTRVPIKGAVGSRVLLQVFGITAEITAS